MVCRLRGKLPGCENLGESTRVVLLTANPEAHFSNLLLKLIISVSVGLEGFRRGSVFNRRHKKVSLHFKLYVSS